MSQPTEVVLERSITRADGVPRPGDENRPVAYWHRSRWRRLVVRLFGLRVEDEQGNRWRCRVGKARPCV